MHRTLLSAAVIAALVFSPTAHAADFTYHGNLMDAGKPAEGKYDLELTLYSAQTGGSVIGGPLTMYAVPVHEGSFSTEADFGPMSKSSGPAYVAVKVRSAGNGDYAVLDARSPVTPDTNTSCPGSWSLDGNAGNPAGSYLGTADNQALKFMVNSTVTGQIGTNLNVAFGHPNNIASGQESMIAGGYLNKTTAFDTAILGGDYNNAVENGAVVIAGNFSTAGGTNSVAAGRQAHVRSAAEVGAAGADDYTFAWSDSGGITSTAPKQFLVHATGGVGINTANGPLGTEPLNAEMSIRSSAGDNHQTWLDLLAQTNAANPYKGFNFAATPGGGLELRSLYNASGTVTYDPVMHVSSAHVSGTASNAYISFNRSAGASPATAIFQVGTTTSNGNGAYLTAGGIWTNGSSRTFKDSFAHVDARGVLDKLLSMPVQTWLYKGDHDEGRHMGPVAEDFAQAFGLGNDETHIGTVDESGVAFAAIQGLNQKVEASSVALKQKEMEISTLQSKLDDVLARLSKLESGKGL